MAALDPPLTRHGVTMGKTTTISMIWGRQASMDNLDRVKVEAQEGPIRSLKVGYLLDLMAMFAFGAYFNIYLHRVGLTGKEIGFVAACGPLVALVSQPFWGHIADNRWGRTRTLRILVFMSATLCPFFLVSSRVVILMIVATVISFFSNSVVPMMDAVAMGFVGGSEGGFAKIRLWGTVGGIISTLVAGALFERIDVGYVFYMYAGLMYLCWVSTHYLPHISPADPVATGAPPSPGRGGLTRLLANRNFRLLALSAFFLQVTNNCHQSFFGVYLVEQGATESIIGIAWLLALVSELAFWLSYRFLAGFDARTLYVIGAGFFSLRWLLNATISAPLAIVVTQMLTGLSLSITYLSGVSLVDKFSPVDLRATGQTIFTGLTIGGGAVVGSLVGGVLYDAVGLKKIYIGAAMLALVAMPPLLRLQMEEGHRSLNRAM